MKQATGIGSGLAAFIFAALVPASALGAAFVYSDFSDASGLTLNGSAVTATNSGGLEVLRLSQSGYSSGTAFTSEFALGPDGSFSTAFVFQISAPSGSADIDGPGGDGLAFLLQRHGVNILPDPSTGYGAYGNEFLPNTLSVKFDTFFNGSTSPSFNDVSGNFIGILVDGNANSAAQANVVDPLNSGSVFHAWIDYDGSTDVMEVRLSLSSSRPGAPSLTHAVDLPALLGGGSAFLGFGAFSGSAINTHDILSWQFGAGELRAVPEPGSNGMYAIGLLGLWICRRIRFFADAGTPVPSSKRTSAISRR